jgi:hypothetical protein
VIHHGFDFSAKTLLVEFERFFARTVEIEIRTQLHVVKPPVIFTNGLLLEPAQLTARYGPYDQEWFLPRGHLPRQRSIRRIVRQILLASKEAQERAALLCHVVADRPAQHWILRFDRIQYGPLRDFALNLQAHLGPHPRKRSQVLRKHDLNHGGGHRVISRA